MECAYYRRAKVRTHLSKIYCVWCVVLHGVGAEKEHITLKQAQSTMRVKGKEHMVPPFSEGGEGLKILGRTPNFMIFLIKNRRAFMIYSEGDCFVLPLQ